MTSAGDVQRTVEVVKAELKAANHDLEMEMMQAALDAAGIVDPTPVSDLISTGLSLYRGDVVGAGLSLIGVIPYLGDALGKTAKGARVAKKIEGLRRRVAALSREVKALESVKHVDNLAELSVRVIQDAKEVITVAPCGKYIRKVSNSVASAETIALQAMKVEDARAALLLKSPAERLRILHEMVSDEKLLDVATSEGAAVFYSGRVIINNGAVSARTLAEGFMKEGKTILEHTPGGRFLDELKIYEGILKDTEADALWTILSARYADQAKGAVTLFRGEMRSNAVLLTEEKLLRAKEIPIEDVNLSDITERLFR